MHLNQDGSSGRELVLYMSTSDSGSGSGSGAGFGSNLDGNKWSGRTPPARDPNAPAPDPYDTPHGSIWYCYSEMCRDKKTYNWSNICRHCGVRPNKA
ncbi:hypothetical protein GMORB2_2414 [Geosmithia morbida]|uniref:Uncharacterized protein n=1 Tax=Geosmithia morbida TaxID=1094350 RepID=A0A9P4YSI8_9HYPO|nr:uncharacterized protein GMORB2_2414 [Geosmithia morbida]KAF4120928.1 hypothetical protein GMORB2_2414 [Geosmithia morbida]